MRHHGDECYVRRRVNNMALDQLPRVAGRHRNRALAQERRTRAVELVLTGHTYQQVADQMGYANRGTVYRIVQETLHARQAESIDELRQLEMSRLDALQQGHWGNALGGDTAAAAVVLKVMEQRARLLGLQGPISEGRVRRRRGRRSGPVAGDDDVVLHFGEDGTLSSLH